MYTLQDRKELESFFKTLPLTVDLVHHMYKKYINPIALRPIANCDCHMSASSYFNQIQDFYSQNNHLFENE